MTDEQRAALNELPWRGPEGVRPALPLPPAKMPLRFAGGWRKRWRTAPGRPRNLLSRRKKRKLPKLWRKRLPANFPRLSSRKSRRHSNKQEFDYRR